MNAPAELDLFEWGCYWSKRITPWVAGILLIGGSLAGAIWMIRQALGGGHSTVLALERSGGKAAAAGKRPEVSLETSVPPEMLRELRELLGESLAQFGIRLARAIDPKAQPFNRQCISALEKGKPG